MAEVYANIGSETLAIDGTNSTTVPTQEAKKTAAVLSYSGTSGTATTLGTVPASKVWRILSASSSMCYGDQVSTHDAAIYANSKIICACVGQGIGTYGNGGVANSVSWSYDCCPVLTAGQTVTMGAGKTGLTKQGSVTYIEEAA